MRTRSRPTLSSPWYNGDTPCIERMQDEESVDRQSWKPCEHSRFTVTQLDPLIVRIGYRRNSTGHEDWGEPITAAKYVPYGNFAQVWSGPYHDSLVEAPTLNFSQINASSIALEISRSSTNLAEALATLKDTSTMLARPGAFIKHLRRRNDIVYTERTPIAELRAAIDRGGKTWLEGTYGYIPLISDLIELTSIVRNPKETLEKLSKPIKKDIREAVQGSATFKAPMVNGRPLGDFHLRCQVSETTTASRLVRVTGTPNPTFQAMGLANQMATYLGLNDFGRLAWELVPYSFVVDWFTDMGKSVASAAALNGPLAYCDVRFSTAIRTVVKRSYSVLPPRRTSYPDGPWTGMIRLSGGGCVTELASFSRSRQGEGAVTGSLVHNGLNAYRTTTGTALLLGRLGKLSKW